MHSGFPTYSNTTSFGEVLFRRKILGSFVICVVIGANSRITPPVRRIVQQNCLTVSNFKLDSVFRDVFGKSATAIIDQLLIHMGEPFDVTPYIHGCCKTPIDVIQTAKHLASWAGLAPQNNESAGKKKTTRIGKAGAYIKPLLVQVALAASRTKANPEITTKYHALKKRRGGKKARIAVARRIIVAIYNMLLKNEAYDGTLYQKADVIPEKREVTATQAFAILRKQGFLIKDIDLLEQVPVLI